MNSVYLCIDLKTFYASVECVQRGLDPFAAPLVVADPSAGKGAICLAVSPKMKALGVRNRCRIFEIPASIAYITALPRMELYMRTAADIYGIYLRYVAPGDIHVYSIDEAFLDITPYLRLYGLSARELAAAHHSGCVADHRHHGYRRHRHQFVSGQSGAGSDCQA